MTVSVDAARLLDKSYEDRPLAEVLNAPISALSGLTDARAQELTDALGVRTVSDLGRNRFIRAAVALVSLEDAGAQ